jgi:hypothetical protein
MPLDNFERGALAALEALSDALDEHRADINASADPAGELVTLLDELATKIQTEGFGD